MDMKGYSRPGKPLFSLLCFPFADGPRSLCAHAFDAVPAQYMCSPLELRYLLGNFAHLVGLGPGTPVVPDRACASFHVDLQYCTVCTVCTVMDGVQ